MQKCKSKRYGARSRRSIWRWPRHFLFSGECRGTLATLLRRVERRHAPMIGQKRLFRARSERQTRGAGLLVGGELAIGRVRHEILGLPASPKCRQKFSLPVIDVVFANVGIQRLVAGASFLDRHGERLQKCASPITRLRPPIAMTALGPNRHSVTGVDREAYDISATPERYFASRSNRPPSRRNLEHRDPACDAGHRPEGDSVQKATRIAHNNARFTWQIAIIGSVR